MLFKGIETGIFSDPDKALSDSAPKESMADKVKRFEQEAKNGIKEVSSTEEVYAKVSEQIRKDKESGVGFDETALEERRKNLVGKPIVDSHVFRETLAVLGEKSTFSWVETDKIIARPSGSKHKGGWGHEYSERKGRVINIAQQLSGEKSEQGIENVFHSNKPNERIKLSMINGPKGPMYSVEDGTHRVAGSKLAELKEIPCEVKTVEYPFERKTHDKYEVDDLQKKINLGLVNGKIEESQNDEGKTFYKVTVEKEILPWIRTTNENELTKISRLYEELYPGSLDNLAMPREALTNFVAYNFFMAGRWDEWKAKHQDSFEKS